MNSSGEQSDDTSSLLAALEAEDSQAVLQWILPREFWLVTDEDNSDEDGTAALMAEVDEVPVIVAFTAQETAMAFSQSMGNEDFSGFAVNGDALVENLPDGVGILLDAETDHCYVILPDLLCGQ